LENAFKHGVERSVGPVSITISAKVEGEALVVAISNTGSALAADCRDGVGLRNCRERLNVIYREAARLEMISDREVVTARVTVP
jgi:sensor histidine kinase YesM